ncbi:MAG: HD-GYP domain-containing protein [Candidatus Aminicenantales bacterium]
MEKGQNARTVVQTAEFNRPMDVLRTLLHLEKAPVLNGETSHFRSDFDFRPNGGDSPYQKLKRMISAKKILRDLNHSCERSFPEEGSSFRFIPNPPAYIKSHLLYFIAVTDENEDTFGHSQFVAAYTLLLAKALGFDNEKFLIEIERGALLHDIGKIGIPESILRKVTPLQFYEKEIIKEHSLLGYEIIEEFDFLKQAAQVVLYHHESYDGSGYPLGLSGDAIPLEARIFSLADTMDAITSDRPYRKGRSLEEAFTEIRKCSGSQFDPSLVNGLLSIPKERWQQVQEQTHRTCRRLTIH